MLPMSVLSFPSHYYWSLRFTAPLSLFGPLALLVPSHYWALHSTVPFNYWSLQLLLFPSHYIQAPSLYCPNQPLSLFNEKF